MSNRTDVQHSRSLVDKAEARLARHLETVHRLGFDRDPRFAAIANETLALMQERLSRLRANHASLLEDQGRPSPIHAASQHAPIP